MDALARLMNPGDLIATTGTMREKCFLIVSYSGDECAQKIKEADEALLVSLRSVQNEAV